MYSFSFTMITFWQLEPNPSGNQSKHKPKVKWSKSKIKAHLLESLALGNTDTHPYWTLKPSDIWASDERFKEYPKDTVCNSIRRYRKSISLHKKSIAFEEDAAPKHTEKFCGQTINNRGKPKLHNHRAKHLLELDMLLQVEQMGVFRKVFSKIAQSTRILI